jgi:PTH1 family peptidyl-tRNA hydrolase
MKLIVGLGNPGPKYQQTHHNIGFLAVDYLVRAWNAQGPIQKNKALLWQVKLDGEDVFLIQPQTFMNLSGESVAAFFKFYKCAPSDLIVIHDELDLDPGVLRIKQGGRNGGHNGLRSIDECLGGDLTQYTRIRLGIGHPRRLNLPIDVSDFVLMRFRKEDEAALTDIFRDVEGAIRLCFQNKLLEAMNKFHGAKKPVNTRENKDDKK